MKPSEHLRRYFKVPSKELEDMLRQVEQLESDYERLLIEYKETVGLGEEDAGRFPNDDTR